MGLSHRPGNSTWVLSVTAICLPTDGAKVLLLQDNNKLPSKPFQDFQGHARPTAVKAQGKSVPYSWSNNLWDKWTYMKMPVHASLRWSYFQTSCSCVPLLLSSLDSDTNQLCAFFAPGVQTCEQIQGVTCICSIYKTLPEPILLDQSSLWKD